MTSAEGTNVLNADVCSAEAACTTEISIAATHSSAMQHGGKSSGNSREPVAVKGLNTHAKHVPFDVHYTAISR